MESLPSPAWSVPLLHVGHSQNTPYFKLIKDVISFGTLGIFAIIPIELEILGVGFRAVSLSIC